MSLITTTRTQLIKSLGGATSDMVEQAVDRVSTDYLRILEEQFSFYDSQLLNLKMALQEWEDIYTVDGNKTADLKTLASQARQLYDYAPEATNAVKYYTAMAVGTSLSIKIRSKASPRRIGERDEDPAQAAFDRIFEAEENEAVFSIEKRQELSNELLINARVVYMFFANPGDGFIKVRTLKNPFEISQIITNPNDDTEVWFYKRTFTPNGSSTPKTLYYQFWRLKDRPVRVENDFGGIDTYDGPEDYLKRKIDSQARIARAGYGPDAPPVFMVMLEWGPFFRAAINWVRQQARFMENRATIVKNRAAYLDEYTVSGGSRAVDAIKAKLASTLNAVGSSPNWETNPAPAAGSALIHNEAVKAAQRSLSTGADDAEKDGRMFRTMPAAAFSMPAALLYMDAEASGNLNAIIELMKRAQGLWESYRSVWHGFYRRLVRFVLEMNGYTGQVLIDIDAPPLVETALPDYTKAVVDGVDAGLVPREEAARLYLVRLGSNNVDELVQRMMSDEQNGDGSSNNRTTPPEPEMTAEEHAAVIRQVLVDLRE